MASEFTPHAWQTASVEDYFRLGGVFIGLDPGVGKTYAFAQIARRCRRPLVVAPAAAVKQTMAQFRAYGVRCYEAKERGPDEAWHPGEVAFASYTWLTGAKQADFFETFRPTDVLMDEFHMVRGLDNSARKRLERWLVAEPQVRVGIATASPMSSRVHDFAFGLRWALRSGVAGLVPPLRSGLDVMQARFDACPSEREYFRVKLEGTPGVYLDVGDVGKYPGEVVLRVVRREPALVLPPTWETPSGFLIESAAHAAVVEKQLAWGWYYDTDPRPSDPYCAARRQWGSVVRRAVEQGLADTMQQVTELRPEEYALWIGAQNQEYKNVFGDTQASADVTNAGSGARPSARPPAMVSSVKTISTSQPTDSAIGCTTEKSPTACWSSTDVTTGRAATPTTYSSGRMQTTRTMPRLRGAGPSGGATADGSETPLSRKAFVGEIFATVPVWSAPRLNLRSLLRPGARTIVWARHQALQERAAEELECLLFREGGRSTTCGTYLPDYRGDLVVASIDACFQSLNLQWFNTMLFLECPSDPEVWKQAVGRIARQGNDQPVVHVDIVINCPAAERSLQTALDRAAQVASLTGKQSPLLQLNKKAW